MQLNTSRFLSDRLLFDPSVRGNLRIASSFWDWCQRIISWIFTPALYSSENRRTIDCFQKYLIAVLGKEREKRISERYGLDWERMKQKGSPLLSRDVAKIVTGAKSVTVEDINEWIGERKEKKEKEFEGKNTFLDLDLETLAEGHRILSDPFEGNWTVDPIRKPISGGPTEWVARLFFDPFLADRERLELVEGHERDCFELFIHNMVALVIKRDLPLGTLIPGPNDPQGKKQFYYVSARIATGQGMISYLFHPAGRGSSLEPIRLFRGTSTRNAELDSLSTLITDLEKDLGKSAYESGKIYDSVIRDNLVEPTIEAGHSLGSTLVQYRLANMDHIKKAYLFCGPGLPEEEVKKFNRKTNRPEMITIRTVKKDRWQAAGQAHIGYQAPSDLNLYFLRYHPPRKKLLENPHVTVFGKNKYMYGIEGGIPPLIRDRVLYYKTRGREQIRSCLGPFLASALCLIRNGIRKIGGGRINMEKGIKIGKIENGRWRVAHFRPVPYTSPL